MIMIFSRDDKSYISVTRESLSLL